MTWFIRCRGARRWLLAQPGRVDGSRRPPSRDIVRSVCDVNSVAQPVHYQGLWGFIVTFPQRMPFSTNLVCSTCMVVASDVNIQILQGSWDLRRLGFSTCFGLGSGLMYWGLYISVFSRICPHAIRFANKSLWDKLQDRPGQKDLLKQVAVDILMFAPLCYFPVFYISKYLIHEDHADPLVALNAGLAKYKTTMFEDNAANAAVWIPGDLVIFTVPAWLRMPLTYTVGFSWTSMLLWFRGDKDPSLPGVRRTVTFLEATETIEVGLQRMEPIRGQPRRGVEAMVHCDSHANLIPSGNGLF
eukprot:CAMPEP_0179070078 /NCGR_PEP_ID=MMETSP0796-20121207/30836_1 /TAXON_ID=73915 /ORGANISM="Pyrodinium bahamense, Strain pbaha01" /LENGTH=299 /DNA_ID=CAMNT_0020767161 /DNA_START=35 /DNA_END=932 /DNA_ORIENTATION=+